MTQFAFMSLQMAPLLNSSNRGTSYSLFVSPFLPSPSSSYFFFFSYLHPPPCALMPVQTSSLRFFLNLPAMIRRNILTLLIGFKDKNSCTNFLFLDLFNCSSFHLVVCLTTGPKPLPKRALHIVQSRASSFK